MNDIFTLLIGVVPAMFLVFVIVEGLKTYGFVSDKSWFTAPKAGLTVGLSLTIIALIGAFYPAIQPVITISAPLIFGGLIAGLFYDLVGELLREKVAAVVNALFGSTTSE